MSTGAIKDYFMCVAQYGVLPALEYIKNAGGNFR